MIRPCILALAIALFACACADDTSVVVPQADSGEVDASDGKTAPAIVPAHLQLTYGGPFNDEANAIAPAPDSGYWIAGYTESHGAGDWDFLVLRANSCGSIRWARTYGGKDKDEARSIQPTTDAGAIVAGTTHSFGNHVDAYLVRIDSEGHELWSAAYGGSGHDAAVAVTQTDNGGFAVLAETYNFGPGTPKAHNLLVFQTDAQGDLTWERTFGGGVEGDAGFAIAQQRTADGKTKALLVLGATESFGLGHDDFWLMKLSVAGEVLWSKAYGGPDDDEGRAITPTADNGFVITGFTRGFGAAKSDIFAIKVGPQGTPQWAHRYGGAEKERGYGIHATSKGYLLVGHTTSFGAGDVDRFVLSIDGNGQPLSMRTIGDDGDDKAEASASAADGGVLLAGRRSDKESGYKNVYIVKTDGQGGALCNQASVALDDLKHAAVQTTTTPFSPAVAIGAKRHPCSTLTQKIVDPNANTTIPCRSSVCL